MAVAMEAGVEGVHFNVGAWESFSSCGRARKYASFAWWDYMEWPYSSVLGEG